MAKNSKKSPDCVIGIDLGGTKILAGVLDAEGNILARAKKKTKAEKGPDEVLDRIGRTIDKAIEKAEVHPGRIAAAGIGAPGPLDPDEGVLQAPPNLPGWKDVPIRKILEGRFGIPFLVENDVNAGTYGEFRRGAGQGTRDMVGIFIGTGIGGGLVIDGRLHRGFNKTAGEVGHIRLVPDGPTCGCGLRGCYEAVAGRLGIVRRVRELSEERGQTPEALADDLEGGRIRSSKLAEAWDAGNPIVTEVLKEMCEHTGVIVGGLINFLNPEMFVLGGGVIEALGKDLMPLIDRTARMHCFENAAEGVRICEAKLGDDSALVGAAMLARETHMKT